MPKVRQNCLPGQPEAAAERREDADPLDHQRRHRQVVDPDPEPEQQASEERERRDAEDDDRPGRQQRDGEHQSPT